MTTEARKDWATDYDIFDPEFIKDPYPVWDELRGKCPVAHSGRYGGSYMPTRYQDVFETAQDWEHFSSTYPLVAPIMVPDDFQPDEQTMQFEGVAAPPISSDPPEHTWQRRLLLPVFSMKAVEKWEPMTREHCRKLIDGFIESGRCDGAADYAQQIPPYVIASMLGIPTNMTATFTQWVREFLEYGLQNFHLAVNSRTQILMFLWSHIEERRKDPQGDDLISYLVRAEVNGQPIANQYILGTCFLLLVAGIDTTWSSIGSAIWHLAQHPEDRKRLIEDPDVWPNAIEELLRAYSPVTMARVVSKDAAIGGRQVCPGEKILMTFPAANRDPEVFPDPDRVILDRPKNPHIAFGAGIHRCAGSNLARMEMRVALQELLARIPDFRLEDPSAVTWAGGQVRGPRSMPIVFP